MELMIEMDDAAGHGTAVIGLTGSVTIHDGREVKEALAKTLATADRVLLHLGGVTEADLSFLQILCSGRMTAAKTGKRLALAPGPSAAFIEAALAAGFPCADFFTTDGGRPPVEAI